MMCSDSSPKSKLSARALGLSLGVIKGVCLIVLAWVSYFFGYGSAMVDQVAIFFHGYGSSIVGGLLGGVWGFVVGLVFGVVFAKLYNCFLCCFNKSCGAESK